MWNDFTIKSLSEVTNLENMKLVGNDESLNDLSALLSASCVINSIFKYDCKLWDSPTYIQYNEDNVDYNSWMYESTCQHSYIRFRWNIVLKVVMPRFI